MGGCLNTLVHRVKNRVLVINNSQMDMQLESVIPEKSPNDERSYEAVILSNGAKVLFVHDAKAEKAACSISVGVGSLCDGERSLGLAHFLEHMLFMGSRKFPRHNEYSEFMSLNSGSDNAYTSDEQTNYYFEIANPKFQQGVERIADFFIKALLTDSCIEKERQAVHEECMLRCGQDNSRKWEILKHFASGPYHNHSIGNNNTLNHPNVRQDLVNFYQEQYSANRMNVVLLSGTPIAQMKKQLLPYFQEIENKHLPPIEYALHFEQNKISKLVRMQSIKDEAIMEFFWVIESTRPHYHLHPDKYITHVLGHEGKNSLLSLLKKNDYACRITSYSHDMPRQTIVGLEIQLTETGQEEYETVYNLVIDYCSWLRAEQHTYEQIREASQVSFRFKEKSQNSNYVCDLSSTMHRMPIQQIISYRAHYAPYDADLLNNFLKQLNPFNLILVYSHAEELKDPITEPHLGGKFVYSDLPQRVNSQQKFESLVKNPFLPLKTDLQTSESGFKVQKVNNIVFTQGNFKVCKGGIKLRVHTAESEAFLQFYANYLELLLKEVTYEAQSLKLEVEYDYQNQLQISLFGFSHTVQLLLQQLSPLFRTAQKGEEGESLFELSLNDLIEEYQNFYQGQVDEIAQTLLQNLLRKTGKKIEETIEQLESYQYDPICKRIQAFWKSARLDWIVVGNFDLNSIQNLLGAVEKEIGSNHKAKTTEIGCLKVSNNTINAQELESTEIGTSGCIVYHEVGPYSEELHYRLSLLRNYIKQPFFDQLRTQKQLAYYLTAYSQHNRGILSLCFLLISSNADPSAISGHIHTFVAEFLANMETDLTSQKFEQLKDSLRTKVLQPHNSLRDYYKFICQEIEDRTFLFDRKQKERLESYLSLITKEQLIDLLRDVTQRFLEVWVVSHPHKEQYSKNQAKTVAYEQIKEQAEYHPDRGDLF